MTLELLSATDILRQDHYHIRRLLNIIKKCQEELYAGHSVPFEDIEKITIIISEFLDSIHYSREEDSYFSCIAAYDSATLKEQIRKFMIEHEFGRRIARNISKYLQRWKEGQDSQEPIARFLRTYSIYLEDHLSKEDSFFDEIQNKSVLDPEEEKEMYEQFRSIMVITKKISEIIKDIEYLESRPWFR